MGQSRLCNFRSASQVALGNTACESTREIDKAEGASKEMLKPAMARVAMSMASVSQGRPIRTNRQTMFLINDNDVHQSVIDL